MDIYYKRKCLAEYAIKRGYRVNYYIPNIYCNWGNYCWLESNSININQLTNKNDVYDFTHEIGHIIVWELLDKFYKRKDKFKFVRKHKILNEALAWLIGIVLAIRFKIFSFCYVKRCYKCLKSYFKKRVKKHD